MLPSRVRRWIVDHPLASIVFAAAVVPAATALFVLPRLDAVEIRRASPVLTGDAAVAVVEVSYGYRLASGERGEVVVRARVADGEVRERLSVEGGRGEGAVKLSFCGAMPPSCVGRPRWNPDVDIVAIGVELRTGAAVGWLDPLFASRRRDATFMAPRSPRP